MQKTLFYLVCSFLITFIFSCSNIEDPNPTGDKLAGQITLINTNLIQSGFYSVSLYSADSSSPFNRVPVMTDSLNLSMQNNLYKTIYDFSGIQPGRYFVASTWSHYPKRQNEKPIVLGIYGTDTSHTSTDYNVVLFPNYEGVYRNIISWTDTTKRLN